MKTVTVQLYQARDGDYAFALKLPGDPDNQWRAQNGLGGDFQKEWTMELESKINPDFAEVDWDAVLSRVIEAAQMNDPVITDFDWPVSARCEPK